MVARRYARSFERDGSGSGGLADRGRGAHGSAGDDANGGQSPGPRRPGAAGPGHRGGGRRSADRRNCRTRRRLLGAELGIIGQALAELADHASGINAAFTQTDQQLGQAAGMQRLNAYARSLPALGFDPAPGDVDLTRNLAQRHSLVAQEARQVLALSGTAEPERPCRAGRRCAAGRPGHLPARAAEHRQRRRGPAGSRHHRGRTSSAGSRPKPTRSNARRPPRPRSSRRCRPSRRRCHRAPSS